VVRSQHQHLKDLNLLTYGLYNYQEVAKHVDHYAFGQPVDQAKLERGLIVNIHALLLLRYFIGKLRILIFFFPIIKGGNLCVRT
jgi:hypothetical protein